LQVIVFPILQSSIVWVKVRISGQLCLAHASICMVNQEVPLHCGIKVLQPICINVALHVGFPGGDATIVSIVISVAATR